MPLFLRHCFAALWFLFVLPLPLRFSSIFRSGQHSSLSVPTPARRSAPSLLLCFDPVFVCAFFLMKSFDSSQIHVDARVLPPLSAPGNNASTTLLPFIFPLQAHFPTYLQPTKHHHNYPNNPPHLPSCLTSPPTPPPPSDIFHPNREKWLNDAVLSLFPDTRECPSSLANFFGGPKRILNACNKKLGTSTSSYSNKRSPLFGLSCDNTKFVEHSPVKSTKHSGEAVKQLAPVSIQTQSSVKKVASMTTSTSNSPLKRNLSLQNSNFWENWSFTGNLLGRIACTTFVGCVIIGVLKMLSTEMSQHRISHPLQPNRSRMNGSAYMGTFGHTSGVNKSIFSQLKKLMELFKHYYKNPADRRKIQNPLLIDNLSSLTMASAVAGNAAHRRQMPSEEAERLVKQWQDIKAQALGPDHQIDSLAEILSESMLLKWQDLASSAKNGACFWRFVLLKLSVLRADVILDELSDEVAEVEALVEEAAELVNDYQPKKPSYYSTYKVHYMLKKQEDGSWRFCSGDIIETSA